MDQDDFFITNVIVTQSLSVIIQRTKIVFILFGFQNESDFLSRIQPEDLFGHDFERGNSC